MPTVSLDITLKENKENKGNIVENNLSFSKYSEK